MSNMLQIGDRQIDFENKVIYHNGIQLDGKEKLNHNAWIVLREFIENEGKAIDRTDLITKVWDVKTNFKHYYNNLEKLFSAIRKALGETKHNKIIYYSKLTQKYVFKSDTKLQKIETLQKPEPPQRFKTLPLEPKVQFVERYQPRSGNNYVEILVNEFKDKSRKVITLFGRVGVGKSTVAHKVGQCLSQEFNFKYIWSTARNRSGYYLYNLLEDILDDLEFEGNLINQTISRENISSDMVCKLLHNIKKPCFLVLDNFETIPRADKDICLNWVMNVSPCSTLITSLHNIPVLQSYSIDEMTRDEVIEFIERLKESCQNVDAGADEIINAINTTNPVFVNKAVELLEEGFPLEKFYQQVFSHGEHGNDFDVKNRFNWFYEEIGDDAYRILEALPLFPSSTGRENLMKASGFRENQNGFDDALSILLRYNLARIQNNQFIISESERHVREKFKEFKTKS